MQASGRVEEPSFVKVKVDYNPEGDADYYTPPGQWGNKVSRGRVGPKYEAWDGAATQPRKLRNYYDNHKNLDMP